MAELQSTKGHCHPRLDVCRQEDEGAVFDDYFEVAVQELEDQIEVGFRREYIHELVMGEVSIAKETYREKEKDLDDVLVM